MKKILLFIAFITLAGSLLAQTGVGWGNIKSKVNFKDSTNFVKAPKITGGSFTLIGDDAVIFTTTGATSLTLPTSGTVAPIGSPTFSGIPLAPTAAPGTNTTQLATTAFVLANGAGSWGSITGTLANQTDLMNYLYDTISIETVAVMQADTTTLFTWNIGIGASGDTANFRKYVPHAYSYGSFYWDGSDTIVVTKLIGKVSSGGSVTVQILWDVNDEDATPTVLNNSPPTITSSTAGDVDISFNNTEIPPGRWVWMTTPTVTTQPTKLRVSLIGYKKNASY